MSQVRINKCLIELARLRQVGGTHRESAVREAFKDLPQAWRPDPISRARSRLDAPIANSDRTSTSSDTDGYAAALAAQRTGRRSTY